MAEIILDKPKIIIQKCFDITHDRSRSFAVQGLDRLNGDTLTSYMESRPESNLIIVGLVATRGFLSEGETDRAIIVDDIAKEIIEQSLPKLIDYHIIKNNPGTLPTNR